MRLGYGDCVSWVRHLPGLVMEFGVAGGGTIRQIAAAAAPRLVYGFDWWRGLPHDWDAGDRKGAFACARPDVPANVRLIDGRFGVTLEPFLVCHAERMALVHIDCDLYCSCAYVLDTIGDRLGPGSLLIFDEISQAGHDGERLAFTRYLDRTKQSWEFLGKQHDWGEVWRRR